MIKVGVNGYGTIGRRVADAVAKQKDMELVGVTAGTKPHYKADLARGRGVSLYAIDLKGLETFKAGGYSMKGTLNDLLQRVDVVVDAAPPEAGEQNRAAYSMAKVRAVFQGGAMLNTDPVTFVAQCNFEDAAGKDAVRVASCNTTALCRVLGAVDKAAGVAKARAVLARRATDPDDSKKGPIDSVVPDPTTVPSHHGPDVQAVLKGMDIVTMAFRVPTTHMHLHSLMLTLKRETSAKELVSTIGAAPRTMLVDGKEGFKATANVIDWAREVGRPRNDVYEAVVWRDSVTVSDSEAYMFVGVHQEAIVIPENVDAIRAVAGGYSRKDSMKATDESLGIQAR